MSIDFSNAKGKVCVSEEVISTIVGVSITECYGVIGMASQKKIKDGVADLLKKDNYSRGVVVQNKNNSITVQVHLVVLYGTKISEVAQNVQEKVKFSIEQMLDIHVSNVTVMVEDVRVDKSSS